MNWTEKRIALVKQDVYQDLYCIDSGSSIKDTLLSSIQRCGPVGLINECGADFYIVQVEPNQECNIWQQKSTSCGQRPISYYENFAQKKQTEIPYSFGRSQDDLAIRIFDVDWSKYDIVISVDVCFPSSFIQQYSGTLWCYMPGEPCMDVYRKSHKKLVSNYHVFLNQELRHQPWTYRPLYFPHYKRNKRIIRFFPAFTRKWKAKIPMELDFPYTLVSSNSIKSLFQNEEREGVAYEFYTYKKLEITNTLGVKHTVIKEGMHKLPYVRIPALVKTKYFISDSETYTRGNGMLEAMAAGCLCLATKGQFVHNYQKLLGRRGDFKDLKSIYSFIEEMESSPERYYTELHDQSRILDQYCFNDPLQRLYQCHDKLLST